jgi:hypothetical protein
VCLASASGVSARWALRVPIDEHALACAAMKLDQKGRFAPPPRLPKHAETVSEALATWPGVIARTHWFLGDETVVDGADFYLGQSELGHLHLDGTAHVAVSKPLRDALVEAELAKPFRWSDAFVVFAIRNASEATRALRLFRLSYERVEGAPLATLLSQLRAPEKFWSADTLAV